VSAGDVTQGVRRDGVAPWDLKAGEYAVSKDEAGAITQVWVRLPNGQGPAELHDWSPVEHDDGTITLSPSILSHPDSAAVDDAGTMQTIGTGWHGYLERGVWREV
jgi:hypothetical protein